jgi:2-oxoglutarate ferredoxin oxidoreductase subunit delta
MSRVRVLAQFCKGCALCVAACPREALKMSDHLNRLGVPTPEARTGSECVGCLNCVLVCPDAAIEVHSNKKGSRK